MINIFLGAALVAAPFFIKDGIQTTTVASQELFLLLAATLGVFCFGIGKHVNIAIMGIGLFCVAFITNNPFGAYQYYQLIMCIPGLMFVALVYSQQEKSNIKFIGKCLGLVCLIESVWVFAQYAGFNPHAEWLRFLDGTVQVINFSNRPASGSLGNINHSAALIAVTIPFLRPIFWVVPLVALFVSDSALPVICALVAIVSFYSYKSKKYLMLIGLASIIFTSGMALIFGLIPKASYFTDSGRVMAWKQLFKDVGFQVYGKGLGYIPETFSKKLINGERFLQAHNEWIELYAIGGLLGVGVGVYLILPVFKNKGNAEINACLIALLVNSLGNFTFHIAPLFMIFGTCYALQLEKD
jgi:hypothetical protein